LPSSRAFSPALAPRRSVPSIASSTQRHDEPGHHVENHDFAPGEPGEERAHDERGERIADVAPHAVDREHQALAFGKAPRERRDRGRVPEAVAETHQGDAGEQHEVGMAESHQQVGKPHPEERHGHEHALAPDGVDEDAAGNIGHGARQVLAGHDEADLAVGEAQLPPDDRQQQVERGGIPVRERMAQGDQPDVAKRPRGSRSGRGRAHLPPAFLTTVSW
jgi:hypothetical protein